VTLLRRSMMFFTLLEIGPEPPTACTVMNKFITVNCQELLGDIFTPAELLSRGLLCSVLWLYVQCNEQSVDVLQAVTTHCQKMVVDVLCTVKKWIPWSHRHLMERNRTAAHSGPSLTHFITYIIMLYLQYLFLNFVHFNDRNIKGKLFLGFCLEL
jgi:hypothetical protein